MSGSIGASVPRRDAPAKVTGAARYTDDLVVPGAWFGLTVRSTEAHARLLGIERDPAFDWTRVVVVTAADIPGENVVHLIADDQPALVADEIRHHAEAVALVAAPDPATARAAHAAIRLRTEPLPAGARTSWPPRWPSPATRSRKGDLEAGFAEADLVIEGEYRMGPQEHVYIEPQAMIAVPEDDGSITVTGSLQCPYYVHAAMARALGLPADRVRVVQAETGGGFGGKEEYPSMLAIHAALLARAAGRPVRMAYGRHEDIVATTKRHPAVVRHRTGVTSDGRLVAQDIEVVLDAGAYTTLSPVVLSRGTIHATGPYRCPNVRVRARAAMTNTAAHRRLPRLRGAPDGVPRRGAPRARRRGPRDPGAGAPAPPGLSPGRRHRDRAGPPPERRRDDVLERAEAASAFEAERARTAHERARRLADAGRIGEPARGLHPGAERIASGVGIALAWHGGGFTGERREVRSPASPGSRSRPRGGSAS